MKKTMVSMITAGLFFFLMSQTALAATAFDTAKVANGLLCVTYDGALDKRIKLTVEREGNDKRYDYDVQSNTQFCVPLQLGDGDYTIRVLENISGTSYRVLEQYHFSAAITSANDMFLYASPIVNYSDEMTAIKEYDKLLTGDQNSKASTIYERVVNDYTYDQVKAAAITAGKLSGYVPVLDDVYRAKKGICYDYAAMMAGVLRDQGIPTKLVMGYSAEIAGYHAWNEVLVGGKWIVVDTTFDSVYAQAGQKYTMEKDAKKFQVIEVY